MSVPFGVAPYYRDATASTARASAAPADPVWAQEDSAPAALDSTSAPGLGTSFSGIPYSGWFPPDPQIAAGPTELLLAANGAVRLVTKSGVTLASTTLVAFFGTVNSPGYSSIFDPRVLFDVRSHRFFLASVGSDFASQSHFFLAVSRSAAPASLGSGDWYFYAFDATLDGSTPTSNWADFPGLGVDARAVYLTANMFSFSSSAFQEAKLRVINSKQLLLTGQAVTWFDFLPSGFSLWPADNLGAQVPEYFVSAADSSGTSCSVTVWAVTDPLAASPEMQSATYAPGGSCAAPPNATQLGSSTAIHTGDKRIVKAVARNGAIWAVHTVAHDWGSGTVAAIRTVELALADFPTSAAALQDWTFGADGAHYYYPAIIVDQDGSAVLVFTRSSSSEYASTRDTGRAASDAANTWQASALLRGGTSSYVLLDSSSRNRWGDYLGIAYDPADSSLWFLGEDAAGSATWETWVGNTSFSEPTRDFGSLQQWVSHFGTQGSAEEIFIADFDGDGKTDIAIHNRSSGGWWVGRSTGSGFAVEQWASGFGNQPDAEEAFVGDFTGDGKADIVIHNRQTGGWWVGRSTGSSFAIEQWASGFGNQPDAEEAFVGDFTGDGKADVAIHNRSSGGWWVGRSTGGGFAIAKWADVFGNQGSVEQVFSTDFDGDGRADVAVHNVLSGNWWVARSTGSAFAIAQWVSSFGNQSGDEAGVGDFTGDGMADLVIHNTITGRWWVGRSTGGSFGIEAWLSGFGNIGGTREQGWIADLTGTGRLDAAIHDWSDGSWYVATSGGSAFGGIQRWIQGFGNMGSAREEAFTGDFTGTGRQSIAIHDKATGNWYVVTR